MKEFKNIFNKVKIDKQEFDNQSKVKSRKSGRPSLPNKRYYHIRLDVSLHKQISEWAKSNHMTKSDAIAQALLLFLSKNSM